MKNWKIYFYGLGTIPIVWSISLLTFYIHSGLILGRLPRYNQPDPKELIIYSDYYSIINLIGNFWIYSLILWLVLIAVYLIAKSKPIIWKPIIISALGQICAISLILSGIGEWYAD